jgi:hypothetical protein
MTAFLQTILRLLFRERGPAHILVTCSEHSTHFHLPDQHAKRDTMSSLSVVLIALGDYGIFLVVNGTLEYPDEQRDYWGMGVSVAGIVASTFFLLSRLGVTWHHELVLTPTNLRVFYVAARQRWLTAHMALERGDQFMAVCDAGKGSLQVESPDGAARMVLREGDAAILVLLAERLSQERIRLDARHWPCNASTVS